MYAAAAAVARARPSTQQSEEGAGASDPRRRKSIAFEVPLARNAEPILIRESGSTPAPRPSATQQPSDERLAPAPSLAAAVAARSGTPRVSGGADEESRDHLRSLRAAEADYARLVVEAQAAEARAEEARRMAAAAQAAAASPYASGIDYVADLLSPGRRGASAPTPAAMAAARSPSRAAWLRDDDEGGAVEMDSGRAQRRSWTQGGVGGGSSAFVSYLTAPAPPPHPPHAHAQPPSLAAPSYIAAAASARWRPSDDGAFSSDSEDDALPLPMAASGSAGRAYAALASTFSSDDDEDEKAFTAALRSARDASTAMLGEAAALAAGGLLGPPSPLPPPSRVRDEGLSESLAQWRAGVSPAPANGGGPLRALLDSWRAGDGGEFQGVQSTTEDEA